MDRAKAWRYGIPRHIGFWMTAAEGNESTQAWRWWDGSYWSMAIDPSASIEMVSTLARRKTIFKGINFVYSNYWPKNARVPRIDPRMVNQNIADSMLVEHAK